MNLTNTVDKEFHQYLLESDVYTMKKWNSLDLPEEGELLPQLHKFFNQFDERAYILAGLKASPDFLRIQQLQPDWTYLSNFTYANVLKAIKDHKAFPLCRLGGCTWIGVARFKPFDPTKIKAALQISQTIGWQILTPMEFFKYEEIYNKQASAIMRSRT